MSTTSPSCASRHRWLKPLLVSLALATAGPSGAQPQEQVKLRVVGGLAGVNQYTRHEAPFWTTQLQQLSGGKYTAEIVPFDRAGIRGQEVLSLVRLGTLPFGTLLLSLAAAKDGELAAPDLAGLNPDAASLRRTVATFRPRLEALLRERHGAEPMHHFEPARKRPGNHAHPRPSLRPRQSPNPANVSLPTSVSNLDRLRRSSIAPGLTLRHGGTCDEPLRGPFKCH